MIVERISESNLSKSWAMCSEMAQKMAYPSFFCSGDWLKATVDNACPEDIPFFLLVKDKGDVKAILPLICKRNALGGKDLRIMGTDFYPDPVGLICASSDRAICAEVLKNYLLKRSDWDRLFLDWIHEDELADWNLPGKHVSVEPFKTLQQDFNAMLGEFKRNNRRYVNGKFRKVIEAGGELVKSVDNSTHNVFLKELFYLHRKRAAERSINSSIKSARVEALHHSLLKDTKNARFYGIRLDQHLVAVFYGFEFCNRFFAYQIAHDPRYGDLGPGTALLYFAIEDCCARGVTEFNFLQGNESYKEIWTNESRQLYCGVLNRDTWRSNLLNGLEQGKTLIKKGLGRMRRGA